MVNISKLRPLASTSSAVVITIAEFMLRLDGPMHSNANPAVAMITTTTNFREIDLVKERETNILNLLHSKLF